MMKARCLANFCALTILCGFALSATAQFVGERPQVSSTAPPADKDSIGYPDAKSALEALEKKPGVKVSIKEGGWTIAEDKAVYTIWSFPPASHPAYPAVVKRIFLNENGVLRIDMKAICHAKKEECDTMMGEFQAENRRLREAAVAGKTKASP